ncbi:MAG: Hsp20/alpha crystallin family protein [Firmicutes bacterium]|nr:Hsp20/alpha crystallin family protein [Bacillota bacterium]
MFTMVPFRKREEKPRLFYSPFREMEDMANRMFGDFFQMPDVQKTEAPAMNIYKEEGNIVVEAQLPGFDKNNITVELENDMLTIKGEHKEENVKEEENYYHREFSRSSFSRSVKLPGKLNPEELKAKYADGVLKISIPSAEAVETKKQIVIE